MSHKFPTTNAISPLIHQAAIKANINGAPTIVNAPFAYSPPMWVLLFLEVIIQTEGQMVVIKRCTPCLVVKVCIAILLIYPTNKSNLS